MSSDTIFQETNTRTGIYCYCMQNRAHPIHHIWQGLHWKRYLVISQ